MRTFGFEMESSKLINYFGQTGQTRPEGAQDRIVWLVEGLGTAHILLIR
jgi:hypothetical protein